MQAARDARWVPLVGDEGAIAGLVRAGGVDIAVTAGQGADRGQLAAAGARRLGAHVTVDDAEGRRGRLRAGQRRAERDAAAPGARRRARRRARVLELYAGDGNFTRVLGASGGVAVEGDRPASARLRSLALARLRRIESVSAALAVERLARAHERFDVVVLDPPRAGAADVIAQLPALAPARLVYVSCDPMTLARDLTTLSRLGYARARRLARRHDAADLARRSGRARRESLVAAPVARQRAHALLDVGERDLARARDRARSARPRRRRR